MTMLEAALAYVAEGFKIFPCNIDKTPLTAHGLKDCTQMQLRVQEMWTQWPLASIGLVTDDLVVVDFDAKSGGKESKAKIEAQYGKMPTTRVHRTGGGGLHYIYRNPNGSDIRNSVKLGGYLGVDLRANGGYIVAPPSPHPSGKSYVILDNSPIAPAPEWLISLIFSGVGRGRGVGEGGTDIPDGERNQTLTSLAGTMRRRGMSQEAILAALKATKCQTPLSDKELETIAKSVARYQPDPLASITDKTDIPRINTDIPRVIADITDQTDKADKTDMSDKTDNITPVTDSVTPAGKIIWPMVDKWLLIHRGERFDLDTICRQLNVTDREHRHSIAQKLSYEIFHKRLEKSVSQRPPLYRILDNTIKYINWLESKPTTNLVLRWPCGIDNSQFGFDGRVDISSKGLIVLAGVTNTGKSVWCRNFMWANMDTYRCVYFSSETSGEDFADYASRMTWANPVGEDGKPKFLLVDRNRDFKDVIEPNSINIIDWLNLGDNFYQIGAVLEGIKEKLEDGIAIVSLQKDPNKELGMGGMWGEHLASLYLTLDFERITVKKAKKWHDWNPNGHTWGFDIVDRGTHFNHIRLLKKCGNCWNGKTKAGPCLICDGTGFVDADTM